MYAVMKVDSSSVGGYTHFRDVSTKGEAEKLVSTADGMTLTYWTKADYEAWYSSSIAPCYR